MLDKRVKPVRDVTRGIRALEKHCDEMVANAAQLAIDMLAAGEACKLPVNAGQDALARVGQLLSAGIAARGLSVRAHVALAELAQTHDAPVAWGDDCPPQPGGLLDETREGKRLTLVA